MSIVLLEGFDGGFVRVRSCDRIGPVVRRRE